MDQLGYEVSSKDEFNAFIKWHGKLKHSVFAKRINQYHDEEGNRIAYHIIKEGRYMIEETAFTNFFHNYYDK